MVIGGRGLLRAKVYLAHGEKLSSKAAHAGGGQAGYTHD